LSSTLLLGGRKEEHFAECRKESLFGIAGSLWLALWTLLVQYGYALFKVKVYSQKLTASLAKEYAHSGPAQILLGGLTAMLLLSVAKRWH
jgi:hypothetical protein